MNVANVPSHPPIFDWNLMKQIYYKRIFIKDSLKYFANTYRGPPTDYFWKAINCFTQKVHDSEYVCKFLISHFLIKMLLFPQVFSRAPPNGSFWKCNKIYCFPQ